jgi:mono/diheme cytochrome c family protein
VTRVLALVAAAVLAGGCGSAASHDGRTLYGTHCSACHSGNGPGPDLAKTQLSRAAILRVIDDGKGTMPADLLSGRDAEAVADYVAGALRR